MKKGLFFLLISQNISRAPLTPPMTRGLAVNTSIVKSRPDIAVEKGRSEDATGYYGSSDKSRFGSSQSQSHRHSSQVLTS